MVEMIHTEDDEQVIDGIARFEWEMLSGMGMEGELNWVSLKAAAMSGEGFARKLYELRLNAAERTLRMVREVEAKIQSKPTALWTKPSVYRGVGDGTQRCVSNAPGTPPEVVEANNASPMPLRPRTIGSIDEVLNGYA